MAPEVRRSRTKSTMTKRISLRLEGPQPHYAVGLMSGTSHDGVSAAVVTIDDRKAPPVQLVAFATFPYPPKFRARLLAASANASLGASEISQLNFALGAALGRAVIEISRRAKIAPARLSFVGSHGHTFFHLPPRRAARGETPSTLQLGESAVIAAMTGVAVVSDFRPMDIAVGGEGAPLAPLSHLWLFGDRTSGRIVQNIGGIGNATYLPPRARSGDPRLIAFDTGPGVGLIDALAGRLTDGKLRMDRDGRMALRGRVSEPLLAELTRHRYFRRRPPKSTGREEFGLPLLDRIEERARDLGVTGDDLVATVTALTARSIADAVTRYVVPLGRVDQLIATGGGANNPALMKLLAAELPKIDVITAADTGVDGDALEAVAFAILGYQMLHGMPGNIPTVTGARSPAILGKLTLPPN
jgi:anhydro-N-acetylmuramic acid kinase